MKKVISKENFSHILFDMGNGEWVLSVSMGGVTDVLNSFRLTKFEIEAIKSDSRYLKRLVSAIKQISASFRDREVIPAVWDV